MKLLMADLVQMNNYDPAGLTRRKLILNSFPIQFQRQQKQQDNKLE